MILQAPTHHQDATAVLDVLAQPRADGMPPTTAQVARMADLTLDRTTVALEGLRRSRWVVERRVDDRVHWIVA